MASSPFPVMKTRAASGVYGDAHWDIGQTIKSSPSEIVWISFVLTGWNV